MEGGTVLGNNIKIKKENNEATLERTNDILKQINEYLDKEKKNIE